LPTISGGEWGPVDLTYFRNAYFSNGHILSTNLLDHINGSALLYYDTVACLDVITSEYVRDSIALKEMMMDSDCVWIETHAMMLDNSDKAILSIDIFSIMPFVAILSLLLLTMFLRRNHRI